MSPFRAHSDPLIPWTVHSWHLWSVTLAMLHAESRRRAGFELCGPDLRAVQEFGDELRRKGMVIHYEPRSRRGFWVVPRRDLFDADLVRVPDHPNRRVAPQHVSGLPRVRAVWAAPAPLVGWRIYADPDAPPVQILIDRYRVEHTFVVAWQLGPFIDHYGRVYYDAEREHLLRRLLRRCLLAFRQGAAVVSATAARLSRLPSDDPPRAVRGGGVPPAAQ